MNSTFYTTISTHLILLARTPELLGHLERVSPPRPPEEDEPVHDRGARLADHPVEEVLAPVQWREHLVEGALAAGSLAEQGDLLGVTAECGYLVTMTRSPQSTLGLFVAIMIIRLAALYFGTPFKSCEFFFLLASPLVGSTEGPAGDRGFFWWGGIKKPFTGFRTPSQFPATVINFTA